LFDVPLSKKIYNNTINQTVEIDYSLVDQGLVITDDYISVLFDGTLHVIGDDALKEADRFTQMPVHIDGAEEIQIFVSEYMLS
jgi:hypothetical protein